MKNDRRYLFFFILVFLFRFPDETRAQFTKPITIESSLTTASSTAEWQPLWLASNRWGLYDEYSSNGVANFALTSKLDTTRLFDYAGGLRLIGRISDQSTAYLNEAYIKVRMGFLRLQAGKLREAIGENDHDLSSGSLGISKNASPIPKITLLVPEYTDLPFTYGFLQFKGRFSHGWLETNRFVEKAYLHEKNVYTRINASKSVYGIAGLNHFAQWGGISSNESVGRLPQSINDFWDVIWSKGGGSTAPEGEQINALGNHLGFWEFGAGLEVENLHVKAYRQWPFEGGSGLNFNNEGDGIFGIIFDNRSRVLPWIDKVLWEYVNTKNQSGPGLSDPQEGDQGNFGYEYGGRDNYYNNYIYKSGWSYHGRIIGTPLFISKSQISSYLGQFDSAPQDGFIVSNRIVAQHIGFSGSIEDKLRYKLISTYRRHYGTYWGLNNGTLWGSRDPDYDLDSYAFYPPQHQWSFLAETDIKLESLIPGLQLKTAVALDTGDLGKSFGILIGVRWHTVLNN